MTDHSQTRPMQVVVASHNPVKIAAVRAAFAMQFADQGIEIDAVSVPSGVSDQPMSDAETRQGARNRVANARQCKPGADFWVGLEGGLEELGGQLMASAWMAVGDRSGRISEARTPTLPLPPEVQALVRDGLELGEANDRVFATVNSKQGGG
ncbi:MAG: DUF84 family protein, partial [Xanthomonadales bacterium]|nr:DUF84 family protein [Xanthomonadales bacterium]